MKAYCINLDRRPDRLEHMARQFERLGIAFERIAAVDGQEPQVAADAAHCGAGFTGRTMGAGAYACFQSHREFWRRLISSGDSHAMVLEDDLVITDGLAEYLDEAWVPRDADLVKLETYESRIHVDAGPGLPAGQRRLFRLRSRHPGTGCYVISARAAQSLLDKTDGVLNDPIDEYMFSDASPAFSRLVTYQMFPAPIIQGDRWKGAGTKDTWVSTSITTRLAQASSPGSQTRETQGARLQRRLKAEWRALRSGTRYTIAKHG